MIRSLKQVLSLCLLCGLQAPSFAIKPVQGMYAGVFLGPTYTQNIDFSFNPSTIPQFTAFATSLNTALETYFGLSLPVENLDTDIAGQLKYSILGGIGGQIGYRFCEKYRLEFEVLYNNNPFNELQLTLPNGYTLKIDSSSSNPYFHIGGDTNTGAGMVNFIYDFLLPSRDGYSAIAPYIGLGVGYAYVQNSLQFHYGTNYVDQVTSGAAPATLYEEDFTQAHSTYAGQGIIGLSYFMDDFCWLSLDARFFATKSVTTTTPITGAQFQTKTQLFSIMLGFNGVLDFG